MSRDWLFIAQTGLIAAGCLVIAAELLDSEGARRQDIAVIASSSAASVPPREQKPDAPLGKDLLTIVLDRPLFDPTRRGAPTVPPPPPAAETENAPAPEEKSNIVRLIGIVGRGGASYAFFELDDAPKPALVAAGDEISGWKVDEITPTEVHLSGPGGARTFRPTHNPRSIKAPGPPQKAVPGAAPAASDASDADDNN